MILAVSVASRVAGAGTIVVGRGSGVGIQVSCSAEDHSAVRDGRFPVSKYSRTSLYIAGHLPYLDTLRNQASNQATFPSYPSYLSTSGASSRIRIPVEVVERRGLPLAGGFRDGEAGDGEAGDGDGEVGDGNGEAGDGDGEAWGRPLSISSASMLGRIESPSNQVNGCLSGDSGSSLMAGDEEC